MKRRDFLKQASIAATAVVLPTASLAAEDNAKTIYLITATVDGSGLVLHEVFENLQDALDFENNDGVRKQLRREYSDAMADDPSLTRGMATLQLHKNMS